MTHRKATRPRFGGRHGQRCKGSVKWDRDASAWRVTFPYLIGYETTARAADLYNRWSTAIGEYREQDRAVRIKAAELAVIAQVK